MQVDYQQQGDELSHYESVASTTSQQLQKLNIKYKMLKDSQQKVCTVCVYVSVCVCVCMCVCGVCVCGVCVCVCTVCLETFQGWKFNNFAKGISLTKV